MISSRLRDALAAFAMLVMIGGPIVAVVGVIVLAVDGSGSGAAVGNVLKFFFLSILSGGILRLLASIDARLEARG
ncbi:hypothetical protein [Brevundimonas sp.]|uniref:hypothetical protein n=1 Tax=Brevundimonas sp. TaxID=1871086 RepID=UPI003D6D9247